MRFNTALLHSNIMGDENTGAILTPIYQSSAFYQTSAEQHEKLFNNKATGFSYTRINNPTVLAFENRMSSLESTSLYGGSIDVFHDFEALDVVDIEKLSKLAHEYGLPLVMDNTVATAYLVKPIDFGADIVVNSTSKYINGNSNSISGVITDSGRFKWDIEDFKNAIEN